MRETRCPNAALCVHIFSYALLYIYIQALNMEIKSIIHFIHVHRETL